MSDTTVNMLALFVVVTLHRPTYLIVRWVLSGAPTDVTGWQVAICVLVVGLWVVSVSRLIDELS